MLVAVDTSPHAERVLRAAFELAQSIEARVHVFHALDAAPADDGLGSLGEATQRLSALIGGAEATLEPLIISRGATWRRILDAAERINADVVVIGSRAARRDDQVLGSTAARVVDRADRPVLVVHERRTLLHLIGVHPLGRN